MNELLKKYGGLILFYGIIVLSMILLNERFCYLQDNQTSEGGEMTIAYQITKGEE